MCSCCKILESQRLREKCYSKDMLLQGSGGRETVGNSYPVRRKGWLIMYAFAGNQRLDNIENPEHRQGRH